jgi:hypothetical protein
VTEWDAQPTRPAFSLAEATFVEWTRLIPPDRHVAFINEVLDAREPR